jgi:hypothetical protein
MCSIHDWRAAQEQGKVGVILYDLSSAFDPLEFDLLVRKLERFGADKSSVNGVLVT